MHRAQVFIYSSAQQGVLGDKSSTQTIKTFYYFCIIANKGINVHLL